MGVLTHIYLIRHSEQLKIKNKIVQNEDSQISNEKIILSVKGEKKAQKISKLKLLNNVDGENRIEVTDRMEKSFERVFSENIGKTIVIVSHGASIKFLLMKWCKLNINNQLEFKNKVINLNSPGVLELLFEDKELIELNQIV